MPRSTNAFLLAGMTSLFVLASTLVATPRAHAYAWMIRHGYPTCGMCHVDPSGGSVLTPYGRAQGSLLLATRWRAIDDEHAVQHGEVLYGAGGTLPEWLMVGGDVRGAAIVTSIDHGPVNARAILMQGDVAAAVSTGRFRAGASLGVAQAGGFGAAIVGGDSARLVSRSHWVGVALGRDQNVLLRAGRMNLPYGLRTIEHTMMVRTTTQTDINWSQQHGVALSYSGQRVRAELMGILGNYQISPDLYRQRGYSGYLEYVPTSRLAFGASSLVTHMNGYDRTIVNVYAYLTPQTELLRVAQGGFVRYSPAPWLVLSGEASYLLFKQPTRSAHGYAAMAQADFEPVQGVHLIASGEVSDADASALGASYGGWASVQWFFFPHFDLRVDGVIQSLSVPTSPAPGGTPYRVPAQSLVAQLHYYF